MGEGVPLSVMEGARILIMPSYMGMDLEREQSPMCPMIHWGFLRKTVKCYTAAQYYKNSKAIICP